MLSTPNVNGCFVYSDPMLLHLHTPPPPKRQRYMRIYHHISDITCSILSGARLSSNTVQVLHSMPELLHMVRPETRFVVVHLQMTIWTCQQESNTKRKRLHTSKAEQNLHSHSSIIASAGKDAVIGRVPCHSIHCSRVMCFERRNERACLTSPDIHPRVCMQSVPYTHT